MKRTHVDRPWAIRDPTRQIETKCVNCGKPRMVGASAPHRPRCRECANKVNPFNKRWR